MYYIKYFIPLVTPDISMGYSPSNLLGNVVYILLFTKCPVRLLLMGHFCEQFACGLSNSTFAQGIHQNAVIAVEASAAHIDICGSCPGMAHELLRGIQASHCERYGRSLMPERMEAKRPHTSAGAQHRHQLLACCERLAKS